MLLLLLFTPSWHRIGPCHRHVWRKADPHCWTPDPARHALGLPRALPHHPQDEPGELVPSATFLPRWWDCVWRHSTAHGNLEKLLMDGLAWRCSNLAGIRGPEGIFCILIYRFPSFFFLQFAKETINCVWIQTWIYYKIIKTCHFKRVITSGGKEGRGMVRGREKLQFFL